MDRPEHAGDALARVDSAQDQPCDACGDDGTCTPTTSAGTRSRTGGKWVPDLPEGALSLFPRTSSILEGAVRQGRQGGQSRLLCRQLLPISNAGLAEFMDGQVRGRGCLAPEPVPAPCARHAVVRIRSHGEEGLFTADVMHNAIQIAHPNGTTGYCLWPDKALRLARRGAAARGRTRRADHANAFRQPLLRLCAPQERRLRLRARHMSELVIRNSVKERSRRGEVASSMTVRLTPRHRDRAARRHRGLRLASMSISRIRACR